MKMKKLLSLLKTLSTTFVKSSICAMKKQRNLIFIFTYCLFLFFFVLFFGVNCFSNGQATSSHVISSSEMKKKKQCIVTFTACVILFPCQSIQIRIKFKQETAAVKCKESMVLMKQSWT